MNLHQTWQKSPKCRDQGPLVTQWFNGSLSLKKSSLAGANFLGSFIRGTKNPERKKKMSPRMNQTHRIRVWYICLHLVDVDGKCGYSKYTIHGCYGREFTSDLILARQFQNCHRNLSQSEFFVPIPFSINFLEGYHQQRFIQIISKW